MNFFLLLLSLACSPGNPASAAPPPGTPTQLSALSLTRLDGTPQPSLAGKVVLFVNVASRCGYTPQYEGLQKLFLELEPRGFTIVGTPCNQFLSQEPGSPEEIATFCKLNYGVTFPLLEKQEVNGRGRSPLYQYLIYSPAGGGTDIGWNFEKFVVGKDGTVRARFPSKVTPDAPELRAAIEAALSEK